MQLFGLSPLVLLFLNLPVQLIVLLVTVQSAQITIGISVTYMLHTFFNSRARSRYSLFAFLQFNPAVSRNGKVHYSAVPLYFVDYHLV